MAESKKYMMKGTTQRDKGGLISKEQEKDIRENSLSHDVKGRFGYNNY